MHGISMQQQENFAGWQFNSFLKVHDSFLCILLQQLLKTQTYMSIS